MKVDPVLGYLALIVGGIVLWLGLSTIDKALTADSLEQRLELQSGLTVEYAKRAIEAETKIREYERRDSFREDELTSRQQVTQLIREAIIIVGVDWDNSEVAAMIDICWKESRYDPTDQNPVSTAYGLWQFLDQTWQYYGIDKTNNPLLQTVAAVRYIEDRYGTPMAALEYHNRRNHY